MKILSTNLFFNFNKIPFLGIQNRNKQLFQKNEEKIKQLPQLSVMTARVYYKLLNNNSINFGQNPDDKNVNNKLQKNNEKEEAILDDLKNAVFAGKTIVSFCREKGYNLGKIRALLCKYKAKAEEIKQKRIEYQNELNEKILKNHNEQGNVEEFCKNNEIGIAAYYRHLNLLDDALKKNRLGITQEQEEELKQKILKNYNEGGSVVKFCQENGIKPPSYYVRLNAMGISPDRKMRSFTKNESEELNEEILKNHQQKGNVRKFCKENRIAVPTYFYRLRQMGINANEEKRNQQQELCEKILENYEKNGDVKKFCLENKISISTYDKYINKIGISAEQRKEKREQELNAKILKNHKECGNVENFCAENDIQIRLYYSRLQKMGINSQKEIEQKQKILDKKIMENYKNHGDVNKFCKKNKITRCTYNHHLKKLGLYPLKTKKS